MPEEVERLQISLEASIKQYERQLARATQVTVSELRKTEKAAHQSMDKIEEVFRDFGKGVLAGAGLLSLEKFVDVMKEAVHSASQIGDLAVKVGTSSTKIQELNYGAVQADLGFEEFEKGLLKFSKSLGEAANGSGDLLKQLRLNNVELRDSQGNMRPYVDLLGDFADMVKNAGSEQDQMLLVTQAFGRGGQKFVEFLGKGRQGLEDFGLAAHEAGAIVDADLIEEARKLDDDWQALMVRLGGYTKTFAIEAAEALGSIFTNYQKMSKSLHAGNWRQFFFGDQGGLSGAMGNAILGPDQTLSEYDPRENRSTRDRTIYAPPTKPTAIDNPEQDAAAAKKRAAAERELAKSIRDRAREQKKADDEEQRHREEFFKGIKNVEEETRAIQLQVDMIGMSSEAINRAKVEQDLYNTAEENGIKLTPELTTLIRQKAAALARTTQMLEEANASQEALSSVNDLLRDSTENWLDQIAEGVNPIKALRSAVDDLLHSLTKLLLNKALDLLFNPPGGGSGGLFGSLFKQKQGGIMPVTSYKGGGVANYPQLSIHGDGSTPEANVPLPNGRSIPVSFKNGGMGGGDTKVIINNNNGSRIRTSNTRDRQGNQSLSLDVDDQLSGIVSDPNSKTGRALAMRNADQPAIRRGR